LAIWSCKQCTFDSPPYICECIRTIKRKTKGDANWQATVKAQLSPSDSAFSSIESLAEMAICPVHCGRLSCPKLLPCGHVFCLSCLDKWSQRQSAGHTIECPMCRRTVARPQAGAAGLPTARAHQAILDYLVSHAARHQQSLSRKPQATQTQQSMNKRKRSLEMRQDLMTQLSEDFLRLSEEAGPESAPAFDVAELANVRDNINRLLRRLEETHSGETVVTEEIESDIDSESADEENEDEEEDAAGAPTAETAAAADTFSATQREMHRLSRYRMREMSLANPAELAAEGFACAGQIRQEPNGRGRRAAPVVVLLTEASRQLLVAPRPDSRGRIRPLPLNIDWQMRDSTAWNPRQMRLVSMQVTRGAIYLSGWSCCRSFLAIVNPETGDVLCCYARDEPTETAAAESFGGFHVEPAEAGGGVVAAQPGKRRVEFFGDDLQPTGHWLVFARLKPRFVAWARQAGTLWVSCPDECFVLAVNDRTGSPPSQLVAAAASNGECRVVLTDSEQGRLFWIRKRRKYIFLQRLQLSRDLPTITGLSAAEDGQLLVTARDRVFCMKPSRSATASRQMSLRCELL
uniref:RING-type domain-containing protein n=1 Tax=Macrostomum lignano TaxID=282301 RepID=A0A1I8G474_9PLAT